MRTTYYSPLRYPGGKSKLAPLMRKFIEKTDKKIYIEPFAGGAAVALELLETEAVGRIVLNDSDIRIYAFWKAVLEDTDRFVEAIRNVPLTMAEWQKQHDICMRPDGYSLFDIGFSAFYMNRTNRSGILKGGVIGGKNQTGRYLMDARFHREHLIRRVKNAAEKKDCIDLYNEDVRDFIDDALPKYADQAFVYFDPSYVAKGSSLYMNALDIRDHEEIAQKICRLKTDSWVVTYDNEQIVRDMYKEHPIREFDLNYSISSRRIGRELMIFGSEALVPDQKTLATCKISMRCNPPMREATLEEQQSVDDYIRNISINTGIRHF